MWKFSGPLILLPLLVLFVGCQYAGSLQGVSCDDDVDCPQSAVCEDGFCIDQSDDSTDAGRDADIGSDADDADPFCPDGTVCGQDCVDLDSDANHCGTCFHECSGEDVCSSGECALECGSDLSKCQNSCVDTEVDNNHCGECENSCSANRQCEEGSCICEAGLLECGTQCVDIDNDDAHCGDCDEICGAGETCTAGNCECLDGLQICGGSCVDIDSDSQHCGDCDSPCSSGLCADGECVPCNPDQTPFGGGQGNSGQPYRICSTAHLTAISQHPSQRFRLFADLDFEGATIDPIALFTGTLDGQDHLIENLSITASDDDQVGLFSRIDGTVSDLMVANIFVEGTNMVGALVGDHRGQISNVQIQGTVTGGGEYIGGLAGRSRGSATITNSGANVVVDGSGDYIGGLVGHNQGQLERSRATGDVTSTGEYVGGLIGYNEAHISNCYALGDVSGGTTVGGLVGYHWRPASLGDNRTIANCHSSGAVSAMSGNAGGLIGERRNPPTPLSIAEVENSYFDDETSGHTSSDGGQGQPTSFFASQGNFTPAWNFSSTWTISADIARPVFQWED